MPRPPRASQPADPPSPRRAPRATAPAPGRRPRRRRPGVGLVELLVALSISAALLTAVAVAVDASFKSYRINQEQSDLMQRARLGVYRITTLIRQTQLHAPDNAELAASFAGGQVVVDAGIQMFDLRDPPVPHVFRYDAPNKRVLAIVDGKSHVLCEGVEAFSVRMEPMKSDYAIRTGGGWDLMRRATLLLTVRATAATALKGEGAGEQTVSLSASVMPRRNTW